MINAIERILSKNSRPDLALPSLLFDIVGLVACLALAYMIRSMPNDDGIRTFMVLLFAFGVLLRVFVGHMRSIGSVLRKPNLGLLFVPLATALSTILVQAIVRSYYSVVVAGLFVVLWTFWIACDQFMIGRLQAPLRILLVEPAPFRSSLERIGRLDISVYSAPPSNFTDWDIVLTDPARLYSQDWYTWLAYADMYGTRSLSAPLVIEELAGRTPMGMLLGEWPHEVFAPRSDYVRIKRVIDTLIILLASPLLVPLFLIVSLAVLICDGAPVFFWQTRVGHHGRPFRMLKYRTMKAGPSGLTTSFASEGDERITRLGHFLRTRRFDELPQIWNVLRGEMSLIGPRPEQLDIANDFEREILMYNLRHNVRPGITGWAQVSQGYVDSVDGTREKLCFDLYYVRRCSLMLDLMISVRTVRTVLTGFGAR